MTIAVIGAGASGMMAALTAAETPENKILLFERQARVGRKLAVTGNGRCNLTNTGAAAENYHGENADFVRPALEKFPPQAAMDYFASLGLLMTEEYGGRVYPLSNSANSVVDVLRFALERAGVELRCSTSAREIVRRDGGYTVRTDGGDIPADWLIVACGGCAYLPLNALYPYCLTDEGPALDPFFLRLDSAGEAVLLSTLDVLLGGADPNPPKKSKSHN